MVVLVGDAPEIGVAHVFVEVSEEGEMLVLLGLEAEEEFPGLAVFGGIGALLVEGDGLAFHFLADLDGLDVGGAGLDDPVDAGLGTFEDVGVGFGEAGVGGAGAVVGPGLEELLVLGLFVGQPLEHSLAEGMVGAVGGPEVEVVGVAFLSGPGLQDLAELFAERHGCFPSGQSGFRSAPL